MITDRALGAISASTRPSTYTGKNRVPAILALWLVLVAIAAARNGGLPDQKHVIALGVGTIVVAGAAAIFPRFVFWILLAAVLFVALNNSDLIANYIDRGVAKVRETTAVGA